jgi:hypothetical protein
LKLELESFLIFRINGIKKQDKMLIDIVVVVVNQKLITANDQMRERVACIVLKHSPVEQFHNLISP